MSMELKEKIIQESGHLFKQYGFRSVTMDEIAAYLSISKKTIYQFFKDKNEVVFSATKEILKRDREEFSGITKASENAIEELFLVSKCLRKMFNEINPSLLFDLQKYHPDAYALFYDYKENFVFNMINNNLNKGIKGGYFRKDIDPNILTRLRVEEVQMSFDSRIYPTSQFDFKEVSLQLFEHFLQGIMTNKGRELFKKYQEKTLANEN